MTDVNKPQIAVIIGAGPAGLTAGLELLRRTGIKPVILEASQEIGGISRTIKYKGNRMDIGGHRFFSKSDRVMQWWMDLMPPDLHEEPVEIAYQGKKRAVSGAGEAGRRASAAGDGAEECAGFGCGALHQVEIDTDTDETDADGARASGVAWAYGDSGGGVGGCGA